MLRVREAALISSTIGACIDKAAHPGLTPLPLPQHWAQVRSCSSWIKWCVLMVVVLDSDFREDVRVFTAPTALFSLTVQPQSQRL